MHEGAVKTGILAAVLWLGLSCAAQADNQPVPTVPGTPPSASNVGDYVLGVGDKLQVTVFGEDDLSGEFQVSSTGTVSISSQSRSKFRG